MTTGHERRVALVTDSTAGLGSLAHEIACQVVPLALEIGGRRYREGPELSSAGFYRLLAEAGAPPATLPPDVDEFVRVYETLLARHEQVLSIHLSAELSQTAERAHEAVRRLDAGDRILVVDSRLAGAALGLLCLEARKRLDRGATPAAAAAAVAEIAGATRIYFSVYSLDFLYLGGRLERVRDSGSRIAEDRPILSLECGRLALVERVIGETTRVDRTIQLVEREFGVGEPLIAAVAHAGERGEAAAARLEEILAGNGIGIDVRLSSPLGPVLCAHTGFDVCGIAVYPRRLSAIAAPGEGDRA